MNADVKSAWLTALRSGDYEQVSGTLAEDDGQGGINGFCCLGVLCDLALGAGAVEVRYSHVNGTEYGTSSDDDSFWASGSLPLAVREWAGLDSPDPFVVYHDPDSEAADEDGFVHSSLAEVNDTEFQNFVSIANIIDEHL